MGLGEARWKMALSLLRRGTGHRLEREKEKGRRTGRNCGGRVFSHHERTSLGVSTSVFPEKFNRGAKLYATFW